MNTLHLAATILAAITLTVSIFAIVVGNIATREYEGSMKQALDNLQGVNTTWPMKKWVIGAVLSGTWLLAAWLS